MSSTLYESMTDALSLQQVDKIIEVARDNQTKRR